MWLLCYLTMSWDLVARNMWNAHGTAFVVSFENSKTPIPPSKNQFFTVYWSTATGNHNQKEIEHSA